MSDNKNQVTIEDASPASPTLEESYQELVEKGIVGDDKAGADTTATPKDPQEAPDEVNLDKFRKEDGSIDVEALSKSYAELEKKLSSGKSLEDSGDEDKSEEGDEEDKAAREVTKEPTESEVESVNKIAKEAEVDLAKISNDFLSKGELDAEDYEKLEKAGYSREMVDTYARGLTSVTSELVTTAVEVVGGAEEYDAMIGWAAENLSDAQAAAFDEAVASKNPDTVVLAVEGLNARYLAALANTDTAEPSRQISGKGASSGSTYGDQSEYMADLADPRYTQSEAFRAKVMDKLARSNI